MAAIGHYDQGDTWVPQATFTVAGTPTDPTTITARVQNPSGTVTTMGPVSGATGGGGITRVSAGVYTISVDLNDAGYWFAKFEGTGAAAGATGDHQAVVDPSVFYESAQLGTRALVSLAETKDWLNYQNIDTTNDLEIARAIVDVSDRVMQEADREFKAYATNPAARTFTVTQTTNGRPWYIDGEYQGDLDPRRRRIDVGDLTSYTLVEILDTDWTTLVENVPLASVMSLPTVRKPWEPIRQLEFNSTVTVPSTGQLVRVTGTWGFPSVPGSIRQAVLDTVAWILDRDVEHYRQDLGTTAVQEGGTTIMLGGGAQRLLSLPPAAQAAAWAFRDSSLA